MVILRMAAAQVLLQEKMPFAYICKQENMNFASVLAHSKKISVLLQSRDNWQNAPWFVECI